MPITYRVGVDIGGTFTDIVLLGSDGATHTKKASSSVENYAQAIVEGLAEVCRESGITGVDIEEIRHGTTVASNAILEHKGAGGADHHQGVSGRTRDPHAADAETLRHELDEAGAAGRALPAPGRRRADRSPRPHRARARSGRRRTRCRCAARRKG